MIRENLFDIFKENAQKVQANVFKVFSLRDAIFLGVDRIKMSGCYPLCIYGFEDDISEKCYSSAIQYSVDVFHPPFRSNMDSIKGAITPAHAAIAETGTVLIESSSEDMRIVTSLSEHHVIVLPGSCIYASLLDVSAYMNKFFDSPFTYLAFITGPSRTADIERVLTIGVHGPRLVDIIVTEEDFQKC